MADGNFFCGGCSRGFPSYQLRKTHRREEHSASLQEAYLNKSGYCPVCPMYCGSLFDFVDHFTDAHPYEFYFIVKRAKQRMVEIKNPASILSFVLFPRTMPDDVSDRERLLQHLDDSINVTDPLSERISSSEFLEEMAKTESRMREELKMMNFGEIFFSIVPPPPQRGIEIWSKPLPTSTSRPIPSSANQPVVAVKEGQLRFGASVAGEENDAVVAALPAATSTDRNPTDSSGASITRKKMIRLENIVATNLAPMGIPGPEKKTIECSVASCIPGKAPLQKRMSNETEEATNDNVNKRKRWTSIGGTIDIDRLFHDMALPEVSSRATPVDDVFDDRLDEQPAVGDPLCDEAADDDDVSTAAAMDPSQQQAVRTQAQQLHHQLTLFLQPINDDEPRSGRPTGAQPQTAGASQMDADAGAHSLGLNDPPSELDKDFWNKKNGEGARCPRGCHAVKESPVNHYKICHYNVYYALTQFSYKHVQRWLLTQFGDTHAGRRVCIHCTGGRRYWPDHFNRRELIEHIKEAHNDKFGELVETYLDKSRGGAPNPEIDYLLRSSNV